MPLGEYRLWQALWCHEGPWGPERTDYMLAQVCMVLANVHGARLKVEDFLPQFGPERFVERTDEELTDLIQRTHLMLGGNKVK